MTKAWFDDPNIRNHFLTNTPIGRFAQPGEMAGMVLFLCSDLASWMADTPPTDKKGLSNRR